MSKKLCANCGDGIFLSIGEDNCMKCVNVKTNKGYVKSSDIGCEHWNSC